VSAGIIQNAEGTENLQKTAYVGTGSSSQIFSSKCKRMGPTLRPRSIFRDNIRMDITEIISEYVDWVYMAQDRNHGRAVVKSITRPWAQRIQ
jgi:hypothetical protein